MQQWLGSITTRRNLVAWKTFTYEAFQEGFKEVVSNKTTMSYVQAFALVDLLAI